MEHQVTYVGIDVSRVQVDVAVRPSGDGWSVNYDESGGSGAGSALAGYESCAGVAGSLRGHGNSHGVSLGGGRVAGGGKSTPAK